MPKISGKMHIKISFVIQKLSYFVFLIWSLDFYINDKRFKVLYTNSLLILFNLYERIGLERYSKNYPKNTILIICCELDIIYFSREWSILEEKVKALNIKHNFEEIFIYDNLTEKSFTVN